MLDLKKKKEKKKNKKNQKKSGFGNLRKTRKSNAQY